MRYKVLVFDLDGTLADSFPIFASALNAAAPKFSYKPLGAQDLTALRSLSAREFLRALKLPIWKAPFLGRFVKRHLTEEAANVKLFPDTESVLRTLHDEGLTLVLLSSNTEANARTVLGETLSSRILHFHCDVGIFGKKREMRRLLKKRRWQAKDVLVIGDEIRDAEAARAVQADFCAVGWGYTHAAALASYSLCPPLQTMPDLIAFLNQRSIGT